MSMSHAHLTTPRSQTHRVKILLSLLVASVLAFAAPGMAFASTTPAPAPPSDTSVSWGVRPADGAQGAGRPNFNYEMTVGESLADALVVTNHGDEVLELDVYAADGFLTPDGSLDILPSGEESTELGSWIDLGAGEVTLAAGEKVEIPFQLVVPDGIQPGDYAAGIVAAMRVESSTGVVTERRLGSRVLLRVAGDLVPSVGVSDLGLGYQATINPVQAGAATVAFTIRNTGNTRIAPAAVVTVAGPFGVAPLRVDAGDIPELLPGTSVERVVEVPGVFPLGVLTADVKVTGTVVERPGDQSAQLPAVAPVSASSNVVAIPWVALGILLLIIALIVWRVVARRRAKRAHEKEIQDAVAAALGTREVPAAQGKVAAAAPDAETQDAVAAEARDTAAAETQDTVAAGAETQDTAAAETQDTVDAPR